MTNNEIVSKRRIKKQKTKDTVKRNSSTIQDVFSKILQLPTLTQKILDLSLGPLCRKVFKLTLPDNIEWLQLLLFQFAGGSLSAAAGVLSATIATGCLLAAGGGCAACVGVCLSL